jgi:hypothetical protein
MKPVCVWFFEGTSTAADWSGRRDLNPRPSPWQGDALPLSYSRLVLIKYIGWAAHGQRGEGLAALSRIFRCSYLAGCPRFRQGDRCFHPQPLEKTGSRRPPRENCPGRRSILNSRPKKPLVRASGVSRQPLALRQVPNQPPPDSERCMRSLFQQSPGLPPRCSRPWRVPVADTTLEPCRRFGRK